MYFENIILERVIFFVPDQTEEVAREERSSESSE